MHDSLARARVLWNSPRGGGAKRLPSPQRGRYHIKNHPPTPRSLNNSRLFAQKSIPSSNFKFGIGRTWLIESCSSQIPSGRPDLKSITTLYIYEIRYFTCVILHLPQIVTNPADVTIVAVVFWCRGVGMMSAICLYQHSYLPACRLYACVQLAPQSNVHEQDERESPFEHRQVLMFNGITFYHECCHFFRGGGVTFFQLCIQRVP